MKIRLEHTGQLRFQAKSSEDNLLILDGDPNLSPKNAFRPTECVLVALASCSSMDIVSILAKMKQSFSDFKVEVDSSRSEEHPKVFTKINLIYSAKAADDSAKDLEKFQESFKKAAKLSMERYCSVTAMLRRGGVDISYRIECT